MTEEETIKYLEERLKENPKSLLFARLADIYIRRGRIDEAITLCSQGIQHHPYYLTGNYILGKAYDTKGEQDKAEAEYKKVLSHDSHYLAAHKALGDMMLAMGWEDKAALHYREILRIDPLEDEVHELLNSLTLGSESADDIAVKEQKGNLNFRPISTVKTEFEEDKNWGQELEKIVTENENESVPEESFTDSEKIQDESKADEKCSNTDQESVSENVLGEEFPSVNKEEETIESLEKEDRGSHEEETLNFEISDESAEKNGVEKPSEAVSETELFTLDSQEGVIGEEKPVSEKALIPDSETADKSDTQVTEELAEEKDFESVATPSSGKELLTGEEALTFDLNEKETEKEVDKDQNSEPLPASDTMMTEKIASEDVKKSEKGESTDASSISPEKEPPVGEEEFSFDFEEGETKEEREYERMSPSMKEEQGKVSDIRASTEKEPSSEKVEEVERVDSSEVRQETEEELKSEDSQVTEGARSSDKDETEKPFKPAEKERVQEDSKVKDDKKGGEDKEQKIISPTLGEIYKAQGQYAKAIRIYETLLKKSPQEKRYQDEIDQLKQKLKD